jgi:hypothetical protein
MGETKSAHVILVRKLEPKTPVGRERPRPKEIGCRMWTVLIRLRVGSGGGLLTAVK